ncbi:MAG: hypothetical protein AAGD09_12925 [Cyanobacteria bacterium P01_F01_bin.56]
MSLIITGVLDATLTDGVPKLVELFAVNSIADLSTYRVANFNNGSTAESGSVTLAGSATAGDYIYVVSTGTDQTELDAWFSSGVLTITGSVTGTGQVIQGTVNAVNTNGDDAYYLYGPGDNIIDEFGVVGTDGTGQPWEYLDGWAYRQGNTTPDGATFDLNNWTFSSPNALDGETTNVGATTPFPIGIFNSNVAPVLSGNATLSAIDEDVAAASNTGNTVAELVGPLITDTDFDPEGIAVTSVDNTNGTWQYSTDGGTTWLNFGALSETNATTLGATSLYSGYLNQNPTAQGWLAFANINPVPWAINVATTNVDETGIAINTNADENIYAGFSNYTFNPLTSIYTPVNAGFPSLDSVAGYTIAFNAQVLSDAQSNPDRAGFSVIVTSDDPTKAIEIAFQDDKIFAQDDSPLFVEDITPTNTVNFDTTQATQYSLKVQNNAYQLFADGVGILSGVLRDYAAFTSATAPDPYETPNFLFLGDDTTSGQGSFRLNQVTVETPTRIRFQPDADYNGDATLQFRAWDTTDGSFNGQTTGVDASQTGGVNAFSSVLGTGTITVTPESAGTPTPGTPATPGSPTTPAATNLIFNFEQWVSYTTIRYGQVYQSALVDFNFEFGGLRLASLFDEADYLREHPDVALAVQQGFFRYGFEHFALFGINEGRAPSDWFDEDYYLDQNPDVAAAVNAGQMTAIGHFLYFGHRENRNPSAFFDAKDYLLNNPDVKAAVDAGGFDSGFEHYIEFGAEEGRVSGLLFEERTYLQQNPDVAAAVQGGGIALGLYHYLYFGQSEGRDPSASFDESAYLERYGDVAAAVGGNAFASGFEHYLLFGRTEGRIAV